MDLDLSVSDYLAFGGVALTILSAFLPWKTGLPGPMDSIVGFQGVGFLAVVASGFVLAVFVVKRGGRTAAYAAIGGGIVIALVALAEFATTGGAAAPGVGIYVALAAGVVVASGGAAAYQETV